MLNMSLMGVIKFVKKYSEDKYSLHYEFSKQRTETDLQCVKQLAAHAKERGNPFDGREILIKNLVNLE